KLHQGTVEAANNVTDWLGTIWMTSVFGAYIADTFLGRFWTFIIASLIYLSGMILLTLSVSIHPLKPAPCSAAAACEKATTLQLGVFFAALYTLTLGTGGTKPNISTIGADQFDEFDVREKAHKLSFFNWWLFSVFFGTLFANTFIVYIQDNVGWSFGYGIPTIGLAISIVIFLAGTPFYRHKPISGSPVTKMARVVVAAVRNWNVVVPSDSDQLYELDSDVYTKGMHRIESTSTLRCLNKACVKTNSTGKWGLCSVTEVEETKQMMRMIPILVLTFIPSTIWAQANTLFIKQGTTLDRHIRSFKIPPASLSALVTIGMLVSIVLYDRCFVKILRRFTKNPRGITLLQRIGIGMTIHIALMVVACFIDRYRLQVAKAKGVAENGHQLPLSIFILLPQFLMMGVADAFIEVGKLEFFYDQAPESMKSLGTAYSMVSLGAGNFISSFILATVARLTKRNGHEGWILNNLNESHLDYYYALLAILASINLCLFLIVTRFYSYKAEISGSMRLLE
ncbi:hypothetical protein M569_16003, partial [Genlisea aurea]